MFLQTDLIFSKSNSLYIPMWVMAMSVNDFDQGVGLWYSEITVKKVNSKVSMMGYTQKSLKFSLVSLRNVDYFYFFRSINKEFSLPR